MPSQPARKRSASNPEVRIHASASRRAARRTILLPEILREVAQQLGTEMRAVGVPTEHGFFATAAIDPEKVGVMSPWARDEFDKTQKRRVSPIPFLVDARGELVGLVTSSPADVPEGAARPSKPWWKFW